MMINNWNHISHLQICFSPAMFPINLPPFLNGWFLIPVTLALSSKGLTSSVKAPKEVSYKVSAHDHQESPFLISMNLPASWFSAPQDTFVAQISIIKEGHAALGLQTSQTQDDPKLKCKLFLPLPLGFTLLLFLAPSFSWVSRSLDPWWL